MPAWPQDLSLPPPASLSRAVTVPSQTVPQNGVTINAAEVDSQPCTRAEWQIRNLRSKLRGGFGRALVSPPFEACGLSNLRLMFVPSRPEEEEVQDAEAGGKVMPRGKMLKDKYVSMVNQGPLRGTLKLKAGGPEDMLAMRFNLTVGSVRRGPFFYDFAEHSLHGSDDFGTNWLEHADAKTGCLTLGVEIIHVDICRKKSSADM